MMLALRRRDDLVCRQVVELVTGYLEGELPRRDARRFERHLLDCADCARYLEQMRVTITSTGRLTPDDLTPEARDEFTRIFRDWVGERSGPGGDDGVDGDDGVGDR